MVRLTATLMATALVALTGGTGCVSSKPMRVEKLSEALKEAMPSSTALASPITMKGPPATQFVTAWQTKLSQLPDPTKNGAMSPGIVGQVFLYTDKFMPAEIGGSLTIVANDATDRQPGQPGQQPNVWHFDAETLKKMTVMDERFGKCLALFLPWPTEWTDVNRLLIQGRYDQPGTYALFAPQSTVTLDLFGAGSQGNLTTVKHTANQLAVPDPKMLMQQANAARNRQPAGVKGFPAVGLPPANAVQQASFQQPAGSQPNWANGIPPIGVPPIGISGVGQPAGGIAFVPPPVMPPPGQEFRSTIPRN